MAWRIVKQPNGLLARFSDIVEAFTHYNMTKEEAIEVCWGECDMGIQSAESKVQAGIDDLIPWTTTKGSGLDRWNDCVETIELRPDSDVYKEFTEIIKPAMMTPYEEEDSE